MPPKQPQTINIDRIRLAGPWAAWWAMFSVAVIGVWYIRGAKDAGEQVVVEVKEVAVEVKALRSEMKQARETMHAHDVRISTLEEWKRSKVSAEKQQRPTANGWGEQ